MMNARNTENISEPADSDGEESLGKERGEAEEDKTGPVSDLRVSEEPLQGRNDAGNFAQNGRHCEREGKRAVPVIERS